MQDGHFATSDSSYEYQLYKCILLHDDLGTEEVKSEMMLDVIFSKMSGQPSLNAAG
jgi:hypothetical protein